MTPLENDRQETSDQERTPGAVLYLVEEQVNPSTDFFLRQALSTSNLHCVRCAFTELPAASELRDATVLFVRYVPTAWARLIARERGRLRRLIFFMDDDVLDVRASAGVPWRYRLKLVALAARRARWLRQQNAEIWVSTPWLQNKYARSRPRLVQPAALTLPDDVRRVFYHGSASHMVEIRWLRSVIETALQQDDRLAFEIVGGRSVNRLFRGLPNVCVVNPMKWPAYQAFLALQGRHIGLAPMLDAPFNLARSCTKFFDITRAGAVGIYSSNSVCTAAVRHEVEGLVLDLDQDAWAEAILGLARDEALRQRLLRNAQTRQGELSQQALRANAGLFDV